MKKTEHNLSLAFAAESKASARNAVFAMKAQKDGYPQIAHLFRAVAEAESVHARRFLRLMRGKIGSTEENIETAFQHEIKANAEAYPKMIQDAAEEGMKMIKEAFVESRDVESMHADLYKNALNDLLSDQQTEYYVCRICGFVSKETAPDRCPVCGAVKEKFKQIE